ncbi:MAG: sulfatase-like hydrolase/transferase [Acetatifactor sp.]|nr:sulfatase-like hydrolase/transferase [Acetatifactor sp.]
MITWLIYAGVLLFFEIVFHLGSFGLTGMNPLFGLGLIAVLASVQTLISGSLKGKAEKVATGVMFGLDFLLFMAQTVYIHIFAQPLLLTAAVMGAADALTNYWRDALLGLWQVTPILLLYLAPLAALGVLRKKGAWAPAVLSQLQKLRYVLLMVVALAFCICVILIGNTAEAEFAEDYSEYYDPKTVMENMGVLTVSQRDLFYVVQGLAGGEKEPGDEDGFVPTATAVPNATPAPTAEPAASGEVPPAETAEPVPTPEPINTDPYIWNLDLEKLTQLSSGTKEKKWLAEYFANQPATNRNEYTGMFEGYNLIFLTAEGFSTYAVREDLTPTLYKMLHSSFMFPNYYVPLWQTSTSDGEYVNTTGLIPDGQFSMKKSADINMPYTLPKFFATEGVYSRAYHDNSLTYYDRNLSHPNLGYDFNAIKLGGLPASEWGSHIFEVEHPNAWPASDYEMMLSTVPQYVNDERFHVYYMTVSGHMNYNFKGNRMSSWNKDAVADLDMSENARAYIACNIELDKAMQSLLEQLEAAGKLENTVICLSADHYPYGMSEEQYEELAGKDLSQGGDMYRNSLILWNAAMEEPIVVDKACCSIDLLPTLLNLFGFDFDSRLFAGRDIFSTEEGVVIMKDQSFVTDTVDYNKKTKAAIWKKEIPEDQKESYLENMRKEVKNRYLFSAYILRNNYYDIIQQVKLP